MTDLLASVLDERSATPPGPDDRLGSVRNRIVRRRRRRVVAAAAGLVAATVLTIGYGANPMLRTEPPIDPAQKTYIEGFPEYAVGARVVAAKSAPISAGSVSVTFTPTTLDLAFFERCDITGSDLYGEVMYALNGIDFFGTDCGGETEGGATYGHDLASLSERYGLAVGTPMTVTLTITGGVRYPKDSDVTGEPENQPRAEPGLPAPPGTMAVAVGEKIPFTDYPLPTRPSQLKPLEPFGHFYWQDLEPVAEPIDLIGDPADPLKPVTISVVWRDQYNVSSMMQTPGQLDFALNGITVHTAESWDYEGSSAGAPWDTTDQDHWAKFPGLRPKAGDTVTLTVTPRHITGEWQVQITPYAPARK